jgi:hypothetical protein
MVPTSRITSPFFAVTWRTAGIDALPEEKYHTTISYRHAYCGHPFATLFSAATLVVPLLTNSTSLEELRYFSLVALQRPA